MESERVLGGEQGQLVGSLMQARPVGDEVRQHSENVLLVDLGAARNGREYEGSISAAAIKNVFECTAAIASSHIL